MAGQNWRPFSAGTIDLPGRRVSIIRASRRTACIASLDGRGPTRRGRGTTVRESKGGAFVEWVHRARCKDEDPELFFPVGNTGPAAAQIAAAKAVCMRCEVRTECLEWAMATGQDCGVWGGLSEDERRALR